MGRESCGSACTDVRHVIRSKPMQSRAERIESLATLLVRNPDVHTRLTGPTVEAIYQSKGIEVNGRQVRRDLEDAHQIAAGRLTGPGALPHWSEDVTGSAIRATIEGVLRTDHEPTFPQLRQAVAAEHTRLISDVELTQLGRRAFAKLYIRPQAKKAEEIVRNQPDGSWDSHKAGVNTDPLNYPNPFGQDPNEIRIRAVAHTNWLLKSLISADYMNRKMASSILSALRMLRDVADDSGCRHRPGRRWWWCDRIEAGPDSL